MHLLQAQPGAISDGSEAVDLGQSPADLLVLTAADTEIASLAAAHAELGELFPSLRLANLMHLSHNASVDLYCEATVSHAKLVVVRLLGGRSYWSYGVEQLVETCKTHGIPLALLPGDDQPDPELAGLCTVAPDTAHRLWQYLVHGGPQNIRHFLAYAATTIGRRFEWGEPVVLARAGLYWPETTPSAVDDLRGQWRADAPVAAVVFYRALLQSGNLSAVDALVAALQASGVNPLPIFCSSLKEPISAGIVEQLLRDANAELVLNTTGFAVSSPSGERKCSPLEGTGAPILQVVFSGSNETQWRDGTQGLHARDIAMNVALPEVDGRVLSRAVSFKDEARFDKATQCQIVAYKPIPDRVQFVAALAARWLRLKRTPAKQRRIALVLANYPNRDGRLGNGVGLDTPAGTIVLLRALAGAGYRVKNVPEDGDALVHTLREGPTNAAVDGRTIRHVLARECYQAFFDTLPAVTREAVLERWGAPETDPFFVTNPDGAGFAIPAVCFGEVVVGVQPARGYNIDPARSYHDPDLVPPHGYFAFYAWLRDAMDVHAIVHMGKHGNLEWLPGKALALSNACYPETLLGPLPHVYPFIVNDPGEGTQAKRRSQAVIVDHLTPPLTRAETYGPLSELERLVDEYYEAAGVDPRRLRVLREEILTLTGSLGLDKDCGIEQQETPESALSKLDNYLCELKEMQIRDGLHVFGESPRGRLLVDLLVALTRIPRGTGGSGDASLLRALAADLGLEGFDPLDCELGAEWQGSRPRALGNNEGVWRSCGDTLERMEHLASDLVSGRAAPEASWSQTRAVLQTIDDTLRPAVEACGELETAGVLRALDGRFLEPGPSGAPTRGRPDVLPTGRNFFSLDTRTVPTPAAWRLGWTSACLLIERFRQEQGAWPRRMALSAWGTSNMRTGVDDIAQALALLGVQPTWEVASGRVTGFEIIPIDVLDRPRVDVTLRISGFFRDAFPGQIDLFDSAVRAVAALDEPPDANPLAEQVNADTERLLSNGDDPQTAAKRAGYRVFGSMPGAYGAGMQALIDERGWSGDADLAEAYLAWGGFAYGSGSTGAAEHRLFKRRLGQVQAVLHNQDNREHDILDSDDYYQFEGGLAAAVRHFSGTQPSIYHSDHSRPESPRVRTLREEVARVVRARVVNPKWIAGVMRHGYKGAFEMAATVDYLFAFAATAHAVDAHHFDAVYDAYLNDPPVREFLEQKNPDALREIAQRLAEARSRGFWQPRSNSALDDLERLSSAECV